MKCLQRLVYGVLIVGVTLLEQPYGATQIVPDGTLPSNSRVTSGCTACAIDGGTVQGVNLFHSFREFSVPTGGMAWFNNDLSIQTILTRVTGTFGSNIDGLIRANGTASVFLLNPNGILFGPNARLDIGGSFLASTADRFQFSDGSEFSAVNPQTPPLLIVNLAPGLKIGRGQAAIDNKGRLEVRTGQSLSLQGSIITLKESGSLISPSGTVEIVGDRVTLLNNARIDTSSTANTDAIIVTADEIGFLDNSQVSGNGVLQLQPLTPNLDVTIADSFSFDDPRLNIGVFTLRAIQNGFSQVVIGRSDGSGEIVLEGDASFADPVILRAPVGSGAIDTSRFILSGTDNTTITLIADQSITTGNIINAGRAITLSSNQGEINTSAGNLDTSSSEANAGAISLSAFGNILVSNIYSVSSALSGNSGDISIVSSNGGITSTGRLDTSGLSFGMVDAGRITLRARDDINVREVLAYASTDGSGNGNNISLVSSAGKINISSNFNSTGGVGNGQGGEITLRAAGNITINNDHIWSFANGTGTAGKIEIQSGGTFASTNREINSFRNVGESRFIPRSTGGEITIRSRSISLENSDVIAGTASLDKAGDINITANESVTLLNGGRIRNQTFGAGDAGNITIDTQHLIIQGSAQITGIGTETFGSGRGGDLVIKASGLIEIVGNQPGSFSPDPNDPTNILRAVAAVTGITTATLGSGHAGNLTIEAGRLSIRDGAGITSASLIPEINANTGRAVGINATNSIEFQDGVGSTLPTAGSGNAGNLMIKSHGSIEIQGRAGLATSTLTGGKAGNLTIAIASSGLMTLRDGAVITADATIGSSGKAGDLTITAPQLRVLSGSRIGSGTAGQGVGGTATINVSDVLEIAGISANGQVASGVFANSQGTGNAGNLTINTRQLIVRDRGQITASGSSQGAAGDLSIVADSILMTNQGLLRAETSAGTGGNIRLQVADSIFLRTGSDISAEAFGVANGGNINMDVGKFVLAVLPEDSDVIAKAFAGNGGRISARAAGIFGFRLYAGRDTPESDFVASSELGIDGVVTVETEDQLEESLPLNFVDTSTLLRPGCTPGRQNSIQSGTRQPSQLILIGRGGLPSDPTEPLSSSNVWEDVQLPRQSAPTSESANLTPPDRLIEAQSWSIDEKGIVNLVAEVPAAPWQWQCRIR